MAFVVALLQALVLVSTIDQVAYAYGTECSFPIHNETLTCGDLLGDRRAIYEEYMRGCAEKYSAEDCQDSEITRLEMNVRQPQSMVNFTSGGFRKVKAPDSLRKMLTEFWEANKDDMELEDWASGNIYTNHWAAPTYLIQVGDDTLEGGGEELEAAIWDAAKEGIQDWTTMELRPSSLYGIRVYTEGAILSPHVDRMPLVSSAIVNVAQDVDEEWPLEVYDRFGNAINITMEPGDMVLYESGSLIHGRPFPLKGRLYANVFIHFEPVDFPQDHDGSGNYTGLPPYILPDSPEAAHWLEENPAGWSKNLSTIEMSKANVHASEGKLDSLKELVERDQQVITYMDDDGWQPIHEATRHGHLDIVEYLIENGVDMNERTAFGDGQSPLNIAKYELGFDAPVYLFLKSLGAEDIEDESLEEGDGVDKRGAECEAGEECEEDEEDDDDAFEDDDDAFEDDDDDDVVGAEN